ncbi:uncharacterized protein [Physcomitrium patens]|uniref:Uncharacterized protein n=1 Tax=Physcomitrium patens TaxID=3218 RepID=A0A2K1J397_PHYPA|nr:uncharacterized protein LOC112294634 [Physcomitrium patens]XP_024401079.1 uncharacterized protein LOC112294634 [Physcomitrium patens]PNR35993.1 hypothetical protein PHYPA_021843 [Physcomitrium patens]|eukprot:XP_024401078.1 uncharacterized protein LOC112294634 [Physcomitrella patens]
MAFEESVPETGSWDFREIWLRDESDDPKSRTYCVDYHVGCMEQPSIVRLVERVNQMHPSLDTECAELQTHAANALKAEVERDWESSFQEYTKFIEVLGRVGYDEFGTKSFRLYADYVWVEAWAAIPLALHNQIRLGNYDLAVKVFGHLRASRNDVMSERLPMNAYASIDQHIRVIDWETSYMLKGRGQEGLAQILAERAVRDFRPRWYLHDEIPAEATLCHLLGNQHRKFGQYETAMKWRSELRKWVECNELSVDAEVEITLSDAFLLCDMDDFSAASHELLKLKQRISDADMDNVHLRRVLHVDNAWWQCRRHLALQQGLQDSEPPAHSGRFNKADYVTTAISLCSATYARSNGFKFTRFMQVVSKCMSCIDDFPDSVRMIENIFTVTSKASSTSSSQVHITDFYFDIPTGQTRIGDTLLHEAFAHVQTIFNGTLVDAASARVLPEDFGIQLENSGIQLEKLRQSATMGLRAESYNVWHLAFFFYRNFLEALVSRCDLPPPGSYLRHAYQTLFIWAALPYALIYHTQLKDYEHSIWLLRIIQLVMDGIVSGPWLGGFVPGVTKAAYVAVELQVRMAAWEWSCALIEEGMVDKSDMLGKMATRNFPNQFLVLPPELGMDDEDRAEVSLCELLHNLYYDVGDCEEAGAWEAKISDYMYRFLGMPMSEPHWQRVAGRVLLIDPDTPAYPRITHVPTCIRFANPPPRSSGSSTPERMFNANPNNSLIF